MNGIRQRISTSAKQHLSNLSKQHDSAPPAPQTDRAFNLQSVQQLQASAAPIFVTIATVLEKLQPVIQTISAVGESIWTAIEPYHPEDLLLALYGMFLIFFGGVFMTLVASFEAAHIFGWDRIQVAVRALYTEWTKARLAFERDNKVGIYIDTYIAEHI